jgi:CheY-like chemotaxis protein
MLGMLKTRGVMMNRSKARRMTMPNTILLVDDEPNVRRALSRSLRGEGYQIVEASSAHEAFEILKHRAVDVIISDHLMPDMSGVEFLKVVRMRW